MLFRSQLDLSTLLPSQMMDKCGAGVKLGWVNLVVTNTGKLEFLHSLNSLQKKMVVNQKSRVAQQDMAILRHYQKKEIFMYLDSTHMAKLVLEIKRLTGSQKKFNLMPMVMTYQNFIKLHAASMQPTPLICLADHTLGAKALSVIQERFCRQLPYAS